MTEQISSTPPETAESVPPKQSTDIFVPSNNQVTRNPYRYGLNNWYAGDALLQRVLDVSIDGANLCVIIFREEVFTTMDKARKGVQTIIKKTK